MSAIRTVPIAIVLVATVWGPGAVAWVPGAAAEPPLADRSIAVYQRKVQRNPADAATWYRLGDAYVQRARETGQPADWDRAEQALRRSLERAPDHSGALRLLAFVKSSQHEFASALDYARRAVDLAPGDASAHGVLGDAYLELGRYREAGDAFETMMRLRADLPAFARRSGLRNLRGDTAGAVEDLRLAIAVGVADGLPREHIAWAQSQLGGELFAIGDLAAADRQYADALVTYPGYPRALAGLAQVRVAQRRPDEGVELYRKALAAAPLPDHAAALGDVYARLGRTEDARRQYELAEYIARLGAGGQALLNRDLAWFLADHDRSLDHALGLARREVEVREDVGAWALLAWTLHKTGRSREALEPLERALALGTRDPRLFFRAGMIHLGAGDTARAGAFLEQALAMNPVFHPIQADHARRALADLPRVAGTPVMDSARAGLGTAFEP